MQQCVMKEDGSLGPAHGIRRVEKRCISEPTWTSQEQDVEIISCPPGHMDAMTGLHSVLGSPATGRLNPHEFGVVLVQRVQNPTLKQRYELQLAAMIRERGASQLSERILFHGTRKRPPEEVVLDSDGFMIERSGKGLYSRGCYFAERMHYS